MVAQSDGDVFRIIVPLDDAYSFDAQIGKTQTAKPNRKIKPQNQTATSNRKPQNQTAKPNRKNCGSYYGMDCSATEISVLEFLKKNPAATHEGIAGEIGKSIRTAQTVVRSLKKRSC
jgi:predicted HTH transcriptional regulator